MLVSMGNFGRVCSDQIVHWMAKIGSKEIKGKRKKSPCCVILKMRVD